MRRLNSRSGAALAATLCATLLGVTPQGVAHATWTDPVLLLTDASAARGSQQVIVQLTGSFHEEDLVQVPFPIQVLIRQVAGGDQYVRYSLATAAFEGMHAGLANGLEAKEAVELLELGSPSNGQLLRLAAGRIRLRLPDTFPTGTAEVQLYVIADDGEVILSNPLQFDIPAQEGA